MLTALSLSDQLILLPWGYTEEPTPDYDNLKSVMDTVSTNAHAQKTKEPISLLVSFLCSF